MSASILLAACGDGIAVPDASRAIDAEHVDPVRVHVAPSEFDSGPATVYFQNSDSTLVLATRTDGAGHAAGFMESNGFVTIVEPLGGLVSIYTYAGVSPGDELYIRPELKAPAPQLTVRALPAPPSDIFEIRTACGTQFSGSEITQMSLVGCTDATDVLVLPTETTYAFANDVQLGATAMIQMPGYHAFEPSTFTVTNVEENASLTIDHASAIGPRAFSTGAERVQAIGGEVVVTRSLPLPEGGIIRSTIDPERDDWPRVITWQPAGAAVTASYASSDDGSALGLRFDPSAMSLAWSETPHDTSARASYAALQWSGSRTFRWQIVAPRNGDAIVRLPTLPDSAFRPPADPFVLVAPLHLVGGAERGLYRILGSWEPSSTTAWPIVGDQGSVVWRTLTN